MGAFETIATQILAARKRMAGFHVLCFMLELTTLIGLLLLCAALLTSWIPIHPMLVAVCVVGLAGLLSTALRHGWRPYSLLRTNDGVARLIERRFVCLGSGVINAVQLQRSLADPLERPFLSEALVEAAIEDAAKRLKQTDLAALIPRGELQPRLLACGGIALCYLLLSLVDPTLLQEGFQRLATARVIQAEEKQQVQSDEPIVADLVVEYRYPAYTELPKRSLEGTTGEIQALKGTVVSIRARAFEPLLRATLLLEGRDTHAIPMEVRDSRDLAGSFTILEAGSWRLGITEASGKPLEEREGHEIIVLEDQRPSVALSLPATDLEVEAGASIPIQYTASDDFGVTATGLVYQILDGGGDPVRLPLASADEARRELSGESSLELGTLPIHPGDRLSFYVEATDNDSVSGPKTGVSATRYLRIHSPEERHSAVMTRLKAVWEQMLDVLATRLEIGSRHRDKATPKTALGAIAKAGDETVHLLKAMNDLLEEMEADVLARQDLLDGLRASRDSIESGYRPELELVMKLEVLASQGSLKPAKLRFLWRRAEAIIPSVEKGILRLDELLSQQSLTDLKDLTRELLAAQDRLRDLIQQYKRSPKLALKRSIEREIRRLRERIQEMMRRIGELMKKVPMEHMNATAMKDGHAAKAMEFRKRLSGIEEALRNGDFDAALAELEAFANDLQSMAADLEQDISEFDEEGETTRRELKAIQEGLERVSGAQKMLEEHTGAIDDAAAQRVQEVLQKDQDALFEGLRQKVAMLEISRRQISPNRLTPRHAENHKHLKRHIETLDEAMERRDVASGLEVSESITEETRLLRQGVEWSVTPMPRRAAQSDADRQAMDGVKDLDERAQEILDELRALVPSAEQRFDTNERQAMQRLQRRQQMLQRQAEQLQERLHSLKEKLPIQGGKLSGGLQEASRHMQDAEHKLGEQRPRPATDAQRQALSQLEQVRQSLKQALNPGKRPKDKMGAQQGHSGRRKNSEKVRIPGSESHQGPKQFRQKLMEAMKRSVPEPYRQQVKRYYRELVQ